MPNIGEQSCHQLDQPLLLHLGAWEDPTSHPIHPAEVELSELHVGPTNLLQQPPKRPVLLQTTVSSQDESHKRRNESQSVLPPSPMNRWLQETVESPWTVYVATNAPESTPQSRLLCGAVATRAEEIGERPASVASARCITEQLSTKVEVGSHSEVGPKKEDRQAGVA